LFVVGSVTAYDKYQDALDKYAKWQQQFGVPTTVKRIERNSADLKKFSLNSRGGGAGPIFVPHRPKEGGRQFQLSSTSSLGSLESELVSPDVIRNTRNQQNANEIGLGGAEYISSHGTPLYKLRKRYPHYGRRKRDTETILSRKPRQSPWTLLDPATGRVIKLKTDPLLSVASPTFQRPSRNAGSGYLSADGVPLYKLRKRHPHYGRRKRDSDTILSRKPRQSPWTLLDPATGRVINLSPDRLTAQNRPSRTTGQRGGEYVSADGTPLYKLKKRNPLGYGRRRREAKRILSRVPRYDRKPMPNAARTAVSQN